MITSPDDLGTPSVLAQRIARFLSGIERARRQPNRREAYYLRVAMEMIENKRYADAETAVVKAEHASPLPAHVASLVQTNELKTVEQLRAELMRITSR